MLKEGLRYQTLAAVTEDNTAERIGSGDMAVLATPAMVALMENAAMLCVAQYLPEGSTTVGASISTSHIRPSAVGATITACAELAAVDGRKLTFKVAAYDQQELIGKGEHVRYIVDREKFLSGIGR